MREIQGKNTNRQAILLISGSAPAWRMGLPLTALRNLDRSARSGFTNSFQARLQFIY